MARYKEAVCRLCRREGMKLFLKGDRCYSEKCGVAKRNTVPGQHGQGRKRVSEYSLQLREKQKVRRYYGVLESQFEKYYHMATKRPGISGENMLSILETRLDNVVYRLGFAMSRAEARLMVVHGHIAVNDKKTDIPSFLTKAGDKISIRSGSRDVEKIKQTSEGNAARPIVKWLEVNRENLEGRLVSLPERGDIDLPIEEHLIIELYSK